MSRRELKRLEKELEDMRKKDAPDAQVTADSVDGNIMRWRGRVLGPEGTPYTSGFFYIDIKIPDDYPYNPPKMNFITKIWHPNVSSQTGAICLDVLGKEWSPALSIRTALLSIQALLAAPEPDDPQDAEVANMYKNDHANFVQTATYWRQTFATENQNGEEDKINKIVEMGFPADAVREALQANRWDETAALNSLLG